MRASAPTYALTNAATRQRERVDALQALLDQGTIRLLGGRGVGPGRLCLRWFTLSVLGGHAPIRASKETIVA